MGEHFSIIIIIILSETKQKTNEKRTQRGENKLKETTTQQARAHNPGGALAPGPLPFAVFFSLRYYSFSFAPRRHQLPIKCV